MRRLNPAIPLAWFQRRPLTAASTVMPLIRQVRSPSNLAKRARRRLTTSPPGSAIGSSAVTCTGPGRPQQYSREAPIARCDGDLRQSRINAARTLAPHRVKSPKPPRAAPHRGRLPGTRTNRIGREVRGLQQHIARRIIDRRTPAAHDARESDRACASAMTRKSGFEHGLFGRRSKVRRSPGFASLTRMP